MRSDPAGADVPGQDGDGSESTTRRRPRGEQRRSDLLAAVIRLIARSGVGSVTHRAVAAEAGVTHRLTTYYFRTKENMVREAFRALAAQSVERARAASLSWAGAPDRDSAIQGAVDAVTDVVLGGLHVTDGGTEAELSLVLEIPRQPELSRDYAEWQDAIESVLVEHASALDSDDPVADARLILAAIRGLQIERIARPDRPLERAEVRALIDRLLTSL
ncbi:MAG: TetR/AcrR family transcriptional regulator [Myxococcota bacterium]